MTEESEVTRLLRGARATDPTPDDVVARLDDTLAELVSARASSETGSVDEADADPISNVVPLRRQRRRTALLVAAAAVIVVGAGGAFLSQLDNSSGEDSQTTSQDAASMPQSSAEESLSDLSKAAPEAEGAAPQWDGTGRFNELDDATDLDSLTSTLSTLDPPLTPSEVRRVERAVVGSLRSTDGAYGAEQRSLKGLAAVSTCEAVLPGLNSGSTTGVTYYLVREASTSPRVIDVITCDNGEERELTSVTLAPRE